MPSLNKFNAVKEYIQSLQLQPTVIALTETWILDGCSGLYGMDGYESYFSCRSNLSGGIAVYVKSEYTSELIESQNGDVSFVKIRISLQPEWIVTAIYMPDRRNYLNLFEALDNIVDGGLNQHTIIGDFNINVLHNDPVSEEYIERLSCKGFELINTDITRPASGTLIDHAWVNHDCDKVFTLNAEDISDHNSLLLILKLNSILNDSEIITKESY